MPDILNQTIMNSSSDSDRFDLENITLTEIIPISVVFGMVGLVGIVGNTLVVFIVLCDAKMRMSMTNILIVNVAVSDLCILTCGIPEIVQFMLNKGWLMSVEMCKVQRSVLVAALYTSVMTLLALCVER